LIIDFGDVVDSTRITVLKMQAEFGAS